MSEKKIEGLKKKDLLEMLYEQSKELDEKKKEIAELNARLNERNINLRNAGSIANAALELYDVFESAQKAADAYVENARTAATGVYAGGQPDLERLSKSITAAKYCTQRIKKNMQSTYQDITDFEKVLDIMGDCIK